MGSLGRAVGQCVTVRDLGPVYQCERGEEKLENKLKKPLSSTLIS